MDVDVGVVTVTVTVEEREDILNKALSIRENNVFYSLANTSFTGL